MSEWLDIMLEEVERKKKESAEAEEETARRSQSDAKDEPRQKDKSATQGVTERRGDDSGRKA